MIGALADLDAKNVAALVAIAGAVLTGGWRLAVFLFRLRDEVRETLRRINVMWRGYASHGEIEAEKLGIRELPREPGNQVPGYVRERFAPFADRLRVTYREAWAGLSADEVKFRIEDRFGPEIIRQVCRPLGWHGGQCLQAAWLIAQEPVGHMSPPQGGGRPGGST